jgi:hypothetical protein
MYHKMPQIELPEAMKLANFSPDEVGDIAFRRCVQRSLPGGSIKAFRARMSGGAASLPNCDERQQRAERTPPLPSLPPPLSSNPKLRPSMQRSVPL